MGQGCWLGGRGVLPCPQPTPRVPVKPRGFGDAEFEHQLLGQPWGARGALRVRSDALLGTWVFHPMEQLSVSFPTALVHGVLLLGE